MISETTPASSTPGPLTAPTPPRPPRASSCPSMTPFHQTYWPGGGRAHKQPPHCLLEPAPSRPPLLSITALPSWLPKSGSHGLLSLSFKFSQPPLSPALPVSLSALCMSTSFLAFLCPQDRRQGPRAELPPVLGKQAGQMSREQFPASTPSAASLS